VASLLPGRYLAVSVPPLAGTEIDPAWLEGLRASATPFSVSAGDAAVLTLKLIKTGGR
jgi:hypothetical protein